MRSLSDSVSRLAAMRARTAAAVQASDAPSRLSDFAWSGPNPGALKAKTYLPKALPDGAPLVVVLHGCTQTAPGYDLGSGWSTLADHAGFALLFPEQQRGNNPNLCFNWFQPGDTRRDAGEALSIRTMIEAFAREHGIDRRRIFITGLSAGGAMTSVMLATYPELFTGGAVIAGLPYGVASTVPEAFDRMRGHGGPSTPKLQALLRDASTHSGPWPILSVWHGSADGTVASGNMDAIVAQWQALHGVAEKPTHSETVDGHLHRVWRNADGKAVIESFRVAGMGHGTPLAVSGGEAYGASGPYMLDVGISSTLRIAEFWGIAGRKAPKASRSPEAAAAQPQTSLVRAAEETKGAHREPPRLLRDVKVEPPPAAAPSKLQSTIENALRAAGLMK